MIVASFWVVGSLVVVGVNYCAATISNPKCK